jgi:hypothetical protein
VVHRTERVKPILRRPLHQQLVRAAETKTWRRLGGIKRSAFCRLLCCGHPCGLNIAHCLARGGPKTLLSTTAQTLRWTINSKGFSFAAAADGIGYSAATVENKSSLSCPDADDDDDVA